MPLDSPEKKHHASTPTGQYSQFFAPGKAVEIVEQNGMLYGQFNGITIPINNIKHPSLKACPQHIKANSQHFREFLIQLLDHASVRLHPLDEHQYVLEINAHLYGGGFGTFFTGLATTATGVACLYIPVVGPLVGGSLISAGINGMVEGATTKENKWDAFGQQVVSGAVTGAVTGSFGAAGAELSQLVESPIGQIAIQSTMAALGSMSGTVASGYVEAALAPEEKNNEAILKRRLHPKHLAAAAASGAVGSAIGRLSSRITSGMHNSMTQLDLDQGNRAFIGASLGSIGGAISSASTRVLSNRIEGKAWQEGLPISVGMGLSMGAVSGAVSSYQITPLKADAPPKAAPITHDQWTTEPFESHGRRTQTMTYIINAYQTSTLINTPVYISIMPNSTCETFMEGSGNTTIWGCGTLTPLPLTSPVYPAVYPVPSSMIYNASLTSLVWAPQQTDRGSYQGLLTVPLYRCPLNYYNNAFLYCSQPALKTYQLTITIAIPNQGFTPPTFNGNIIGQVNAPVSKNPLVFVDKEGDAVVYTDTIADVGANYGKNVMDVYPTVSVDSSTGLVRLLCVSGMQGNHSVLRTVNDVPPRVDLVSQVQYANGTYTLTCLERPPIISVPAAASYAQNTNIPLQLNSIICTSPDGNPLSYSPMLPLPHPNITWMNGTNQFYWTTPLRGSWSLQSCCTDGFSAPVCGAITAVTINDQAPMILTPLPPGFSTPNTIIDVSILPNTFTDVDDPSSSLRYSLQLPMGVNASDVTIDTVSGIASWQIPTGMPSGVYTFSACSTDPAPYSKTTCTPKYVTINAGSISQRSSGTILLNAGAMGQSYVSSDLSSLFANPAGYRMDLSLYTLTSSGALLPLPTGFSLQAAGNGSYYLTSSSIPPSLLRSISLGIQVQGYDVQGTLVGSQITTAQLTTLGLPPVISSIPTLTGPRSGISTFINATDPEGGPITCTLSSTAGFLAVNAVNGGCNLNWGNAGVPTNTNYQSTVIATDINGQSTELPFSVEVIQPPTVAVAPSTITATPGQTALISISPLTFSSTPPVVRYSLGLPAAVSEPDIRFNVTTGEGTWVVPSGTPSGLNVFTQCAYQGSPFNQSTCTTQTINVIAGTVIQRNPGTLLFSAPTMNQTYISENLANLFSNPFGYGLDISAYTLDSSGNLTPLPTSFYVRSENSSYYLSSDAIAPSTTRTTPLSIRVAWKDNQGTQVGVQLFNAQLSTAGLAPVITPFTTLRGPLAGASQFINISDPEGGSIQCALTSTAGFLEIDNVAGGCLLKWGTSGTPTSTTYSSTLIATDVNGQTTTAPVSVVVNQPPNVAIAPVTSTGLPGQAVDISIGTGAFTDDTTINHYALNLPAEINASDIHFNATTGKGSWNVPTGTPAGLRTIDHCAVEGAPDYQQTCTKKSIVINAGTISPLSDTSLSLSSLSVGNAWRSTNLLDLFANPQGYRIVFDPPALPNGFHFIQNTTDAFIETDAIPATLTRSFPLKITATLFDNANNLVVTPTFSASLSIPGLAPVILPPSPIEGPRSSGGQVITASDPEGGPLTCTLSTTAGFLTANAVPDGCDIHWGNAGIPTSTAYNSSLIVTDSNGQSSTLPFAISVIQPPNVAVAPSLLTATPGQTVLVGINPLTFSSTPPIVRYSLGLPSNVPPADILFNMTTGNGTWVIPSGMPAGLSVFTQCAFQGLPYQQSSCTTQAVNVITSAILQKNPGTILFDAGSMGQPYLSSDLLGLFSNPFGYNLEISAYTLDSMGNLTPLPTSFYLNTPGNGSYYLASDAIAKSTTRTTPLGIRVAWKDNQGTPVGTQLFNAQLSTIGLPPVITPVSTITGSRSSGSATLLAIDPEDGAITCGLSATAGFLNVNPVVGGCNVNWGSSGIPTATSYTSSLTVTDVNGQQSEQPFTISVIQPPTVVTSPSVLTVTPGQAALVGINPLTFSATPPVVRYSLGLPITVSAADVVFNISTGVGTWTVPPGMPSGLNLFTQCAYQGLPYEQSSCTTQTVNVVAGTITQANAGTLLFNAPAMGEAYTSFDLKDAFLNPFGYGLDITAYTIEGSNVAALPPSFYLKTPGNGSYYLASDAIAKSTTRNTALGIQVAWKNNQGLQEGVQRFNAQLSTAGLAPVITSPADIIGPQSGGVAFFAANDPEGGPISCDLSSTAGFLSISTVNAGCELRWGNAGIPTATSYSSSLIVKDTNGQSLEMPFNVSVVQPPRLSVPPSAINVLPGQTADISVLSSTFSANPPIVQYRLQSPPGIVATFDNNNGHGAWIVPLGAPSQVVQFSQCVYQDAPYFQHACQTLAVIVKPGTVTASGLRFVSATVGLPWESDNIWVAFDNPYGYSLSLDATGLPTGYQLKQNSSGAYIQTNAVPATLTRSFGFKVTTTVMDTEGGIIATPSFDATLAIPGVPPIIQSIPIYHGTVLGGSLDIPAIDPNQGTLTCSLASTFGFLDMMPNAIGCHISWASRLGDPVNKLYQATVTVTNANGLSATQNVGIYIDDLGMDVLPQPDFNGTISTGLHQIDCARSFQDNNGGVVTTTLEVDPALTPYFTALSSGAGVVSPASGIQLNPHWVNCTGRTATQIRSVMLRQTYQNQALIGPNAPIEMTYPASSGLVWQQPANLFTDNDGANDIVSITAENLPSRAVYTPGIGINFPVDVSGTWCNSVNGPRLVATDRAGSQAIAELCVNAFENQSSLWERVRTYLPLSGLTLGALLLIDMANFIKNKKVKKKAEIRLNRHAHWMEEELEREVKAQIDEETTENIRRAATGEDERVVRKRTKEALQKQAKTEAINTIHSLAILLSQTYVQLDKALTALKHRIERPVSSMEPTVFSPMQMALHRLRQHFRTLHVMLTEASYKTFLQDEKLKASREQLSHICLSIVNLSLTWAKQLTTKGVSEVLNELLQLYILTAEVWVEMRQPEEWVYEHLNANQLLKEFGEVLQMNLTAVGRAEKTSERKYFEHMYKSKPWILKLNQQFCTLAEFIYTQDVFGRNNDPLVVTMDVKHTLTHLQSTIVKAMRTTLSLDDVLLAEEARATLLVFPDNMPTNYFRYLKDLVRNFFTNQARYNDMRFQLARGIPRIWITSTLPIRAFTTLAIEHQSTPMWDQIESIHRTSSPDAHITYWAIWAATQILQASQNEDLSIHCLQFLESIAAKKLSFKLRAFEGDLARDEIFNKLIYPALQSILQKLLTGELHQGARGEDSPHSHASDTVSSASSASTESLFLQHYIHATRATLLQRLKGFEVFLDVLIKENENTPDGGVRRLSATQLQQHYATLTQHPGLLQVLLLFLDVGVVRAWLELHMLAREASPDSTGELHLALYHAMAELLADPLIKTTRPKEYKAIQRYARECKTANVPAALALLSAPVSPMKQASVTPSTPVIAGKSSETPSAAVNRHAFFGKPPRPLDTNVQYINPLQRPRTGSLIRHEDTSASPVPHVPPPPPRLPPPRPTFKGASGQSTDVPGSIPPHTTVSQPH